jgi:hypothetical protein
MSGKISRGIWSVLILGVALLFAGSLWAAGWEKVTWGDAPKTKKGDPVNGNTAAIVGKNNTFIAFASNHLVHFDGKNFKEIKHKYTGKSKWDGRNFVINSEKDVWLFGDNGLAMHYNGSEWKLAKTPVTGIGRREGRLWGSGCAKPDLCFAGTRDGRLVQMDGMAWKEVKPSPADGARIYSIQCPSENMCWMAGEAFFAKWDGKAWTRADIEAPRIYDMEILGNDFGWAVGDGGAFFKYDGKTFTKVNVKGSFFRMRGVSCESKSDCWAVGDAGAAFKWDGNGWTKVKLGTFDQLSRVKLAHGQGIIVGTKAQIYTLK